MCTLDVLDHLRFLEKFWDHVHVNSSTTFDNVNRKTQQVTAHARKYVTLFIQRKPRHQSQEELL